MVYDCFLFFNELELLEIRLHELDKCVDRVVLVESPFTFTGQPKPLYYELNKQMFSSFHHKIVHLVYDPKTPNNDPWFNEREQRKYLLTGVGPEKEGYIILSDVDEIPHPHAAKRDYKNVTCLRQTRFDFFLNCKAVLPWWGSKIIPLSLPDIDLQKQRDMRYPNDIADWITNAGWHFSYLGCTMDAGLKISSFSHAAEVADPKYKDAGYIVSHLLRGVHPYNVALGLYRFEPIDISYPLYIQQNQERFKHLIWPAH